MVGHILQSLSSHWKKYMEDNWPVITYESVSVEPRHVGDDQCYQSVAFIPEKKILCLKMEETEFLPKELDQLSVNAVKRTITKLEQKNRSILTK